MAILGTALGLFRVVFWDISQKTTLSIILAAVRT
jgi:hypothetical protein